MGALRAPTKGRVAGGPWVAADSPQDTALMTGGQRQAQVAQPTGGSPAWRGDVPSGHRTDVSRGSSSQAFSESPTVLPAAQVWKSTPRPTYGQTRRLWGQVSCSSAAADSNPPQGPRPRSPPSLVLPMYLLMPRPSETSPQHLSTRSGQEMPIRREGQTGGLQVWG